jgi:hypothetical protein
VAGARVCWVVEGLQWLYELDRRRLGDANELRGLGRRGTNAMDMTRREADGLAFAVLDLLAQNQQHLSPRFAAHETHHIPHQGTLFRR